jgi:trans-aconitate 2-methyltransferase
MPLLDLWRTTYMHALAGENAVTERAAGGSLRPFLDCLPEDRRAAFHQAYAEVAWPHYPRRPDDDTLLPFHRLFMVARKRWCSGRQEVSGSETN